MARTKGGKQSAGRRKQEDDAVDVLEALATRLGSLGKRKWKAKDLAAALSSAAGGLQDAAVKSYILENLEQCAAQLQERLLTGQEGEAAAEAAAPPAAGAEVQPAKRTKRRAAAGPPPELQVPAEAEKEVAPASLATSRGYTQLACEAADGQLDPRFTTLDLLLARTLPAEGLVAAHVRRVHSADGGAPPPQQAHALVAAAATALAASAALAAEAGSREDALRMFAPAVAHLCAAQEQLAVADAQGGSAESGGQQQLGRELERLAGRTLASMHAALQCQALGGDQAACYWRSNPERLSTGAAAEAAGAVGAAICGLRTSLRMRAAGGQAPSSQALSALGAAAAADLRLLAPFAQSSQLSALAHTTLGEAGASPASAHRFLALYLAVGGMEAAGAADYLHRLVAARTAAAVAEQLGQGGLGARILDEAAQAPVSQAFVRWLGEQPPSAIVSAALAASRSGLATLSHHLARECGERGLQALLTAMQRGASAGGGGAPGEGGVAAAGDDALLDDLLFFSDKAGDATMLARDWGSASEDDDDEAGEGEGRGLDLGELPDAGQPDPLLQG